MNPSRAQLLALIPAVLGALTFIGSIGFAAGTTASGATQTRTQRLDMCFFDSGFLAAEAHSKCSLSVVPSPTPGTSDLDLKMDKLKQLLDSSVGASVQYGTGYTHMALASILPGCLTAAGSDMGGIQDWCALFATNEIFSVDQNLGGSASAVDPKTPDDLISADRLMQLQRSNQLPKNSFIPPNQPPEPGCIAVWENVNGGPGTGYGHVGIVLDVSGKTMTTVEGNTSPANVSCTGGSPPSSPSSASSQNSNANSQVLVKEEVIGAPVDCNKSYQGCIRPWPPTDAELSQWNAGITAVGNRYSGISQLGSPGTVGQLSYNGCRTEADNSAQKLIQQYDQECPSWCQDFYKAYDGLQTVAGKVSGYFDSRTSTPAKPAN